MLPSLVCLTCSAVLLESLLNQGFFQDRFSGLFSNPSLTIVAMSANMVWFMATPILQPFLRFVNPFL